MQAGKHKIEVLTETLIRIRFLSGKKRTTNPYLNSIQEKVKTTISEQPGNTTIGTQNWTLSCAHNSTKPLEGLSLEINGQQFRNLHTKDNQNLGGCVTAVDRWDGWKKLDGHIYGGKGTPRSMPDGILSKRGWSIASDTGSNLFVGADKDADAFYLFIYGRDYQRAINDFFKLTGKPPLLPRWAFGNWFARFQPWDPKDYKAILAGFRSRGMGIDVLFCDMNWHSENWFSMRYNTDRFGDMAEFFKWAKDENVHLFFNHHPDGLEKSDPRSLEVLKRAGLDPQQVEDHITDVNTGHPTWKLNYKNPDVFRHYWDLMLKPLLDDGVEVHWIDGGPGLELMKAYYEKTQEHARGKRVAIFTRQDPGLLSHRYPLAFSGDTFVSWKSLNMTLEVSLAGSLHGLWWGHDLGGHKEGETDNELFCRWMQVAALSSPMFFHSSGGRELNLHRSIIRRPWLRGEQTEEVAERFIRLRYSLLPYFEMAYRDMHESGRPLTCMMPVAFPNEEDAYKTNRDQFMLGHDLLVAPILAKGENGTSERKLWLPPGEWIHWFNDSFHKGNQWITVSCGINDIPLYQRVGSMVPVVEPVLHSGEIDYANITLRTACSSAKMNETSTLYEDDGVSLDYSTGKFRRTRFSYTCDGNGAYQFAIESAEGQFKGAVAQRSWTMDLRNIDEPKSIKLGAVSLGKDFWEYHNDKRRLLITLPESSVKQEIAMSIIAYGLLAKAET